MSFFLIYLLRYGAFNDSIPQDQFGFVYVDHITEKYPEITAEKVFEIVQASHPPRYQLKQSKSGLRVKALNFEQLRLRDQQQAQGFQELSWNPQQESMGYHFTKLSVWLSNIRLEGLISMSSPFIFFNQDFPTESLIRALSLEVIIEVNISKAAREGLEFKLDPNMKLVSNGIKGRISPQFFSRASKKRLLLLMLSVGRLRGRSKSKVPSIWITISLGISVKKSCKSGLMLDSLVNTS